MSQMATLNTIKQFSSLIIKLLSSEIGWVVPVNSQFSTLSVAEGIERQTKDVTCFSITSKSSSFDYIPSDAVSMPCVH